MCKGYHCTSDNDISIYTLLKYAIVINENDISIYTLLKYAIVINDNDISINTVRIRHSYKASTRTYYNILLFYSFYFLWMIE